MALGGGGGGGGPVGFSNSFTGPAEALELIGDHCYAYSGDIIVGTSATTMLKFTTGNYYSLVNVQLNYTEDQTSNATYQILMNGTVIQKWVGTGSMEPHMPQNVVPIVIPPYTEIEVQAETAGSGRGQCASITGRIYR